MKTARIDDAGVKIGGARKDRWARLVLSELADMNGSQLTEAVVKDRAWPKPDYGALVEAGWEPRAAALCKIIRDRTAAAPRARRAVPFETVAADYATVMADLAALADAMPGYSELKAGVDAVMLRHQQRPVGGAPGYCPAFAVYKTRFSPLSIHHADEVKAKEMVAQGFPELVPAWKRGVAPRFGAGGMVRLVRAKRWVGDWHPDEASAWAALEAESGTKAKPEAGPQTPDRPHLDALRRIGPDHRAGSSVSPDAFIRAFGFRGVEFGNWVPQDERQRLLDLAFDGLHDLADAWGMDALDLSLGGTMALAFGARGDGKAMAHYEPGLRVINGTRVRGAGSLCHEMFHGLDHRVGVVGHRSEIEGQGPRFASGGREQRYGRRADALPLLPREVGQATDDLLTAMTSVGNDVIEELAVARTGLSRAEEQLRLFRALGAEWERTKRLPRGYKGDQIREGVALYGSAVRELRNKVTAIEESGLAGVQASRRRSRYLAEALKLDPKSSNYWSRPNELLARAGECQVYDWLVARGRRSDYLVHSVDEEVFSLPVFKGNPYPTGAERRAINAAMGRWLDLVVPAISRVGSAEVRLAA